jgi:hypothetical protein
MGTRLYINTEDYMVNERIMGAPSGTIEKIEEMNEVGTEGFYDWIYEKENETVSENELFHAVWIWQI